jgi:hypothetical protein
VFVWYKAKQPFVGEEQEISGLHEAPANGFESSKAQEYAKIVNV